MDSLIATYKLTKIKQKVEKLDEEYELPELASILDDIDGMLSEIDTISLDETDEQY